MWGFGVDNFQTKLAVMGPGLVKWYFKIHVQVYLSMWREWSTFIVYREGVPWDCFLVVLFVCCCFLLFSAMNLQFHAGHSLTSCPTPPHSKALTTLLIVHPHSKSLFNSPLSLPLCPTSAVNTAVCPDHQYLSSVTLEPLLGSYILQLSHVADKVPYTYQGVM